MASAKDASSSERCSVSKRISKTMVEAPRRFSSSTSLPCRERGQPRGHSRGLRGSWRYSAERLSRATTTTSGGGWIGPRTLNNHASPTFSSKSTPAGVSANSVPAAPITMPTTRALRLGSFLTSHRNRDRARRVLGPELVTSLVVSALPRRAADARRLKFVRGSGATAIKYTPKTVARRRSHLRASQVSHCRSLRIFAIWVFKSKHAEPGMATAPSCLTTNNLSRLLPKGVNACRDLRLAEAFGFRGAPEHSGRSRT